MATERTDEERVPLNRERVLEAAFALADDEGLDALSMRRLGQRLGVEAMSLYNHVDSKDDLLTGILDLVAAEWEAPDSTGPWRKELADAARSAHQAILRHPWSATPMMTPQFVAPTRLEFMDRVLAVLRTAGFSDVMVHHAFHALDALILASSLRTLAYDVDPEEEAASARKFVDSFPEGAYPYLVEHIQWHAIAGEGEYTEFEFGLKLILDALERDLEGGR